MDIQKYTRNFAIVAHIDHGKSTLADRLLELTGTIEKRDMQEQVLDSNPIERERGITIKLAPVRMKYKYEGQEYVLNLIDTPGHVDFSYEVSRSLSACEGIILVVDATSGIQAQTLAHMQLIKNSNLKVIPVVNKIDLPSARVEETVKSLIDTFNFDKEEIIEISAKNGVNIDKVLHAVIQRIPPPSGNSKKPLTSLIFSSVFHQHKGVIVFIRVMNGEINIKSYGTLKFIATNTEFLPTEIGIFSPRMKSVGILNTGEVGYVATGLKDISLAQVGDTLTICDAKISPLPGYKQPKPMVYLCLFPITNDDYQLLRESLSKLHLMDSSFTYQPHFLHALGKGFLCGFLGLLHADIIQERLDREFRVNVIATSPTVEYKILKTDKAEVVVKTPDDYPNPQYISVVREPVMYATIFTPKDTVGTVMQLCEKKRAEFVNLEYFSSQSRLSYLIPLSEMITDFFDQLKSKTNGFASLDYEFYEYRQVDTVKMDILLNHKPVDAFSQIVVQENVQHIAVRLVEKLKELIPRHQFQIPIQAAIAGKIIARSDIKSFRKDVTAKLYGGDRTRKDKLLEAQRKGKKRMREFGRISIPSDAFFKLYQTI